jgi:ABC-type transport system involved in multi-copper enzyme maturation permease subunit
MNITAKQKLLIVAIIIVIIFCIVFCTINKLGAFKDFQQDSKQNQNKCDPPSIPTNLKYKIKGTKTIQIKWNTIDNSSHYKIYCYKNDPLKGSTSFSIKQILNNNTRQKWEISDLKHGRYWFRIRAINNCGEGEFSDSITVSI